MTVLFTLCITLTQAQEPTKLEVASVKGSEAVVTLVVRQAAPEDPEKTREPGREPIAVIAFLDQASATVHKLRVRLSETIGSTAEDTFDVTVPRCPAYASVKAEVAWLAAFLSGEGKELSSAETIEVGKVRLARFTDGSVRISGKVRNGLTKGVQKVAVSFQLGSAEHPLKFAGGFKPGAVRDFEFFVPDCPAFDGYSYSIAHELTDDPKDPEPEALPTVKKTGSREAYKPRRAGDPPKPGPDPAPAKDGGITAEVRGVKWIEGYQMVNKKYTGDVAFLRIALRGADGKPVQPTGKFTAVLSEGGQPRGAVTRFVKKESWGLDAAKIDAKNVNQDIVAYHKETGELWIGLVRADKFWLELKMDVALTIEKVGAWEWKGLAEKFEAKPRGPDKK